MSTPKTNWRSLIQEHMTEHGDSWNNVIYQVGMTPTSEERYGREFEEIDETTAWQYRLFYDGHGLEEGCPFTVWTRRRVYFPACYDGAEFVSSVPRNPVSKPAIHVGG